MKSDCLPYGELEEFSTRSSDIPNIPYNLHDPVEVRIRILIDSINPNDRESLIYNVSQLIKAAKDPLTAKRDWLVSLYENKKWITSGKAKTLKKAKTAEALFELETICLEEANLRTGRSSVLRYGLPPAREQLGDHIRRSLEQRGINPEKLKVRSLLQSERVEEAVRTGCDRDFYSIIHLNHHGGYDGEELAMIRYGITSAADTLYLSNLKNWKDKNPQEKFAVLVYSTDALEGIGPTGYMHSNGFHAFHFTGEIKRRSLLAVFSR